MVNSLILFVSFNRYSIEVSEKRPKPTLKFRFLFFLCWTELDLRLCFRNLDQLSDFNFILIHKLMEEIDYINRINFEFRIFYSLEISETALWKIKIKSICFPFTNELIEKCSSTAVLLKKIPLALRFFSSCRLVCGNISITKKRINWQINISNDLMHISGAIKAVIENVHAISYENAFDIS